MKPLHVYHVYADGDAQLLDKILQGHLEALSTCGVEMNHLVSIIGSSENRERVKLAMDPLEPEYFEAVEGFESVTIQYLQTRLHGIAGYVLFANTKGAWHPSELQNTWRRRMTHYTVSRAKDCIGVLDSGDFDVAGVHWLTREQFPSNGVNVPFFGGNFWWATAEYLRTLPLVSFADRWRGETWIGEGNPRAHDFCPGWPDQEFDDAW